MKITDFYPSYHNNSIIVVETDDEDMSELYLISYDNE